MTSTCTINPSTAITTNGRVSIVASGRINTAPDATYTFNFNINNTAKMVGTRKSKSKDDDVLLASTRSYWKDKELRKLLIDGKDTMKGEARSEPKQEKVYHWRGAVYAVTDDTPQEWINQQPERSKRKPTQEATPQPPATSPRPKKRNRDVEDDHDEPAKAAKKAKKVRHSLSANLDSPQRPRRRSSSIALSSTKPRGQSARPVDEADENNNGPPKFNLPKQAGERSQARTERERARAKSRGFQTEMLGEEGSEALAPSSSSTSAARSKGKGKGRAVDLSRLSSIRETSGSISQEDADNFARTIVKLAKINSRIDELQDNLDIDTLEAQSVKDLRMRMKRAKQPEKRVSLKRATWQISEDGDDEGDTAANKHVNLSSEWETTEMDASETDVVAELLNKTSDPLDPQSIVGEEQDEQDEDDDDDEDHQEGGVGTEQEQRLQDSEGNEEDDEQRTSPNIITVSTEQEQEQEPASDALTSNTTPSLTRDGTTASSTMSSNTPPTTLEAGTSPNAPLTFLPASNRGGQPLRWSLKLSDKLDNPDRAESLIYKGRLEGEGKAARRRRIAREVNFVKNLPKANENEVDDD